MILLNDLFCPVQDGVAKKAQPSDWSLQGLFGTKKKADTVDADWSVTCCKDFVAVTCPVFNHCYVNAMVFQLQVRL